jgi:hypothetical protein
MARPAGRGEGLISGALMKKIFTSKYLYLFAAASLYSAWAAYYIYNTSFTIPNGDRYFGLFDDAMISMRYAWNVSHGNGLVYNPGERIEGITNMLMTLFMGIWTLLLEKRFAVLAVQISGVGFILLTGYLCMSIGTRIIKTRQNGLVPAQVLLFAAGLVYFPFNFWVLFGMETGMVTVLLMLAVLSFSQVDGEAKVKKRLGIFLGLAFIARPDTAVAVSIVMAFRFFGIVRKKGWFRALVVECGIIALFVLGVTLFRYFYYGTVVPNTYTLKVTGMPLAVRIDGGFVYLRRFAGIFWPVAALALLGGIIHRNRLSLLLTALFVGFTTYHITIGWDPFVYWRQLSPYVPIILTAFIAEVYCFLPGKHLDDRLSKGWSWARLGIANTVLIAVSVGLFAYLNWEYRPMIEFKRKVPTVNSNRGWVIKSLAMNDLLKPGASLGLFHAGMASYYTNFRCVDFLGKSDRVIASRLPDMVRPDFAGRWDYILPGHNKYDLNYSIQKLRPTYIEGAKWEGDNLRRYARKHYRVVRWKYSTLTLRKNSPHVKWGKLKPRHYRR